MVRNPRLGVNNATGVSAQSDEDTVTPFALAEFTTGIAEVVDALGSDGFGQALLDLVRLQVGFDSALVVLYARNRRPRILTDALCNPRRQNTAGRYAEGAYLLDPFYTRSLELAAPAVLRMKDIAPADFRTTEYFNAYYKLSGVADEVNFLVPITGTDVFAVCIERADRDFDESEIVVFNAWLPLIASLTRRHMAGQVPEGGRADPEHLRLQDALDRFGSSRLTPRESQVVKLLLQGLSAPEIGIRLGMSVETARVHRRNIYDKLQVSSLAELFSMALRAIQSTPHPDGDPLADLPTTPRR